MLTPEQTATIIMVTAFERGEILEEVRDVGIREVLTKPVSPSALFDAIAEALDFSPEPDVGVSSPQKQDQLRGARVLLAEDNSINQQVAREILQIFGVNVDMADDGEEAVKKVRSNVYDAVLMDIQMPHMDGLEAARRIRRDVTPGHLPIIAMTAHAMTGDREKSLEAGMQDHVTKPIDPEALYTTLTRWIRPPFSTSGVPKTDDPGANAPHDR